MFIICIDKINQQQIEVFAFLGKVKSVFLSVISELCIYFRGFQVFQRNDLRQFRKRLVIAARYNVVCKILYASG